MSDQQQFNQPDDPIERGLRRLRELLAARGATPHEVEEAVEGLREHARVAAVAAITVASTPFVPPTEAEMAVIDAREERLNAIAAEHNLVSIWSYGEVVEMDAPHPYHWATTVVHTTISGVEPESGVRCWGGDGGRFEAAITGPRWLDLWIAADAAIRDSGDLHHLFVETFKAGADPAELHLGTGS